MKSHHNGKITVPRYVPIVESVSPYVLAVIHMDSPRSVIMTESDPRNVEDSDRHPRSRDGLVL